MFIIIQCYIQLFIISFWKIFSKLLFAWWVYDNHPFPSYQWNQIFCLLKDERLVNFYLKQQRKLQGICSIPHMSMTILLQVVEITYSAVQASVLNEGWSLSHTARRIPISVFACFHRCWQALSTNTTVFESTSGKSSFQSAALRKSPLSADISSTCSSEIQ